MVQGWRTEPKILSFQTLHWTPPDSRGEGLSAIGWGETWQDAACSRVMNSADSAGGHNPSQCSLGERIANSVATRLRQRTLVQHPYPLHRPYKLHPLPLGVARCIADNPEWS